MSSNQKPLEIICKKVLLTISRFKCVAVFKPGVGIYMADTLSRAYIKKESSGLDR